MGNGRCECKECENTFKTREQLTREREYIKISRLVSETYLFVGINLSAKNRSEYQIVQ